MSTEEYTSVLKQNEGFLLDVADKIWVKWTAEFKLKTRTRNVKTENQDWIKHVSSGELFPALPDLRKDAKQCPGPYIEILKHQLDLRDFIEELAGWLLLWKAPET